MGDVFSNSIGALECILAEKILCDYNRVHEEEQRLREIVKRLREKAQTENSREIQWQEISIKNDNKTKEKANYASTMVYAWDGLARANDEMFYIGWNNKEQEITIYYIEYKGEKLFLHENLREYDLPEITEDTVDLALRVNALTTINPRYVTLVDDVIKHPNAYVKKMKKYLKNKTDLLFRYDEIAEYLLACLNE